MAFSLQAWNGNSNKTAGTTVTVSTLGAVPAGALVVVAIAMDNIATTDGVKTEVTSVTDSVGNTYTEITEYTNGQGAAAGGATVGLYQSVITTALLNSSTITATVSSVTAKAINYAAWTFNGTLGVTTFNSVATDGNATSTAALSGLTSRRYFWVHAGAIEAVGTVTFSTSTLQVISSAGTTGGNAVTNMTSVLTATEETSNVTGKTSSLVSSTAGDWAGTLVGFYEILPTPVFGGAFLAFF